MLNSQRLERGERNVHKKAVSYLTDEPEHRAPRPLRPLAKSASRCATRGHERVTPPRMKKGFSETQSRYKYRFFRRDNYQFAYQYIRSRYPYSLPYKVQTTSTKPRHRGFTYPGNDVDRCSISHWPLVNSLPHCSFLAKPSSNAVEPTPRLLQLRRGERLIFQHDLLLEEVAEAFRFGCNPFADCGCG